MKSFPSISGGNVNHYVPHCDILGLGLTLALGSESEGKGQMQGLVCRCGCEQIDTTYSLPWGGVARGVILKRGINKRKKKLINGYIHVLYRQRLLD